MAATPAVSTYSQNSDMPETGQVFSYAQITDLHIGRGEGDYGTPGFDDAPPSGDVGLPAQNLRSTVDWINANQGSMPIEFVVVTGDIADSAEKSEFMKAKEILDTLVVPYIPIPGNHDMWPYTASAECNEPCGDQYFKEIFASEFETLRS
ncbi:MAG: metallophosphoesterase, partial [Actinobacteria bacterium]|nr:metallophosphoesterase [Actinomycetota bacterium]